MTSARVGATRNARESGAQMENATMLYGLGIERNAPQIAAYRAPQACLLVAEQDTPWALCADTWREHGAEVSVLIRDPAEHEPAFVRRLYAIVARAELASSAFVSAALIVNATSGVQVAATRARLASSIAQALLRAGGPVALHLDGPEPASLERIQRSLAYELRGPALTLRVGKPYAAAPWSTATTLAG